MKIGVFLESKVTVGGGFHQSLNALTQLQRVLPDGCEYQVFTTFKENLSVCPDAVFVKQNFLKRLVEVFLTNKDTLLFKLVGKRMKSALELALLDKGIDLVYFLSSSKQALYLNQLPYIFTVWDLCHRDFPEFPEVRCNGEFEHREKIYTQAVKKALLTLTDSEALSRKICQRYGVDEERLLMMPFQAAGFIHVDARPVILPFKKYFFYPAQFWSHKNHIRILEALQLLKEQGESYYVVFSGNDHGNLAFIRQTAMEKGLLQQVFFAGYVSGQEMKWLYLNCQALVMPTYFGPTNLPPIEAWSSQKPVIYSKHLQEQVGDAAICIDPDSAIELSEAMHCIYHNTVAVDNIVEAGNRQIISLNRQREKQEELFKKNILTFKLRLSCGRKC